MKRFFALAALVLGLASCQTEPEGLDVRVDGEVATTITVSIPETETRAGGTNSALGAFDNVVASNDYTIRYILQVYYGERPSNERLVKYSDGKEVNFDVRLVPGRAYKFVAWADVVEDDNYAENHYDNEDGLHYNTTDLTNITLKDTWVAMDETRDAFTDVKEVTDFNAASVINLELKRPFAKLRVITTDMVELGNLGITPVSAKVTYSAFSHESFNAFNGTYSNTTVEKTHTYAIANYADQTGANKVLFTDYFFADDSDVVKFQLDVYESEKDNQTDATRIKYNNFNTDIAVKRNYLTTIQGNILTDGNNIKVTVDKGFENGTTTNPDYEYTTISSADEFIDALTKTGQYIVISDIRVNSDLIKAGTTVNNGQPSTLSTRAGGNTTLIDLNGNKITIENKKNTALATVAANTTLVITDTDSERRGKIELTEDSKGAFIENNGTVVIENGNIESNSTDDAPAIVNNGTLNIEGGNFGEDTIENTQDGNVNITGGTFESDPSEFVDDDYAVVENEDGSYELEIKDVIATIGEVEYRSLQKAFDAVDNGTIQLIGDVTLEKTATLAEGKTATLDLNGKTITHADEKNKYAINNLGTLTINGNGTVNSRGIYNGYGNGEANVADATLTIENGTFNAKGENGGAAVYNYGTANINGGSFTSIGGYSLNSQSGSSMTIAEGVTANNGVYTSGATLTINGGEISGNRSGYHVIYCWNATITINGGTFYNNNSGNSTVMAAGTTKITYNGGTYGIKDGRVPGNGNTWTSCLLDSQNSAEAVINGGTYNGGFRVQAGTSMTINGGSFNDCYGSNYNIYGTATVKGGTYTDARAIAFAEKYVANGYMAVDNGDNTSTVIMPTAKVGSTIYTSIDEAIAAWTNNSTLTLLADVTLSDVVNLNSTEHHILDLGTYTMTAASGKNAFEIIARGTGASERTAITIKADANNPGCINAGSKSVVYYNYANGTATGDDRPIIKIEGGIFRGGTSSIGTTAGIYFKGGSAARQAATLNISGGEFYCAINGQSKSKLSISGGLFHYSVGSQGDSTANRLIWGGTFKTLGFMTADSNNTKFWFGTSMGNSNVGVYVNKDGYLVVGGPVITEAPNSNWEKKSYSSWSSYLKYSSAAEYGLYYEK